MRSVHVNRASAVEKRAFIIYGKEVAFMSEKETKILKTFALIIPKLSESDKSYLLGLGEGMAIKAGGNGTDGETGCVKTIEACGGLECT